MKSEVTEVNRIIGSFVLVISITIASAASAGDAIQVARDVPYLDETTIATKIVEGCTALGTRLATSLQRSAAKYGVDTVLVDEIDTNAPGRVFRIQITSALSAGNAFVGHRKSMTAKGELFLNGKSQGDVTFSRSSSGGFGAGFKGSCSVLARCSNTLGDDFARWLKERN